MWLNGLKYLTKGLTPPIIWASLRRIFLSEQAKQHISFKYNFKSWDEASTEIDRTYADYSILENVRHAALQVKLGKYPYERDGVLFERVIPNWQLITLLFMHLRESKNKSIQVLDFGGGLGTTFYQFKNSLSIENLEINWIIVEQEHFVKVGQIEFTTSELSFSEGLSNCKLEGKFVALALGVLQYLREPFDYLQQIIELKPDYIFIDATPFSPTGQQSISIQIVPKSIHASAYVAHVFTWTQLCANLAGKYDLISEWDCTEQPDPQNVYRGAIFKAKE